MNTNKLIQWKEELENITADINRLEGSLDSTMKSLADTLEIKTKEHSKIRKYAEKKIKELEKAYKENQEELNKIVDLIEEQLEELGDL